jgi:hypothetical protein
MIVTVGTTFPKSWQYGPEEIAIVASTRSQIDLHFPNDKNLLINTTWFGPQFDNGEWTKIQQLIQSGQQFDNLFLLSVIDPMYLMDQHLELIQSGLGIRTTYRIGMYADSPHEWNFHSFTVAQHCPPYHEQDLAPGVLHKAFLLYQRKPRPHRLELTQRIIQANILERGTVTLGSNEDHNYDWTEGQAIPLVLTIDDPATDYSHNGQPTEFGGIPNDLVSIGRLDIWRQCFLNVVSETEFESFKPRFVTEKMWKPIIGLRPFLIHGQTETYAWLRKQGFKTFNHYWSHVAVETDPDVHATTLRVLEYVSAMTADQLHQMYTHMLPDIQHNRQRYWEFAKEQQYKMAHLFE